MISQGLNNGTYLNRKQKFGYGSLSKNRVPEEASPRDRGRNIIELHEVERITPGAYVDDINDVKPKLQQYETERYKGALMRYRSRSFLGDQLTRQARSDETRAALAK